MLKVVNPEFCPSLGQGIQSFKERKELFDVVVVVGGCEFPCHRLVLALSSPYFLQRFKVTAEESNSKRLDISDTRIKKVAFEAILDYIYTGMIQFPEETVLDLWYAVNKLKIQFLLPTCKRWVKENTNLDKCVDIYHKAKELQDDDVAKHLLQFMRKNFKKVSQSNQMIHLLKDELKDVISSDCLDSSSEDLVVESIFQWVTGQTRDNNDSQKSWVDVYFDSMMDSLSEDRSHLKRGDYLGELLSVSRLALVSRELLQKIQSRHEKGPKKMDKLGEIHVRDALMYQDGKNQESCPPSAVYRLRSEFENVLIFKSREALFKFGVNNNRFSRLRTPEIATCSLGYKGDLYFWSEPSSSCQLNGEEYETEVLHRVNTRLSKMSKQSVIILKKKTAIGMAIVEDNLYTLYDDMSISVLDMSQCFNSYPVVCQEIGQMPDKALRDVYLTSQGSDVVAIGHIDDVVVFNTFDTVNKTSLRIESRVQASNDQPLAVFKKGDDIFMLESNGLLSKVDIFDDRITTTAVTRLWEVSRIISFATIFNDQLLVFQHESRNQDIDDSAKTADVAVPGLFKHVRYIALPSPLRPTKGNCTHWVDQKDSNFFCITAFMLRTFS